MRRAAPWLALGAATVLVALGLDAAGLPSPTLFAALLVGLAAALAGRAGSVHVPRPAFVAAQAVVGVALGAYLQSSSLSAIAGSWLPVLLVSLGTLALSLGAGVVLSDVTALDRPTATLGMVAGGTARGLVRADRAAGRPALHPGDGPAARAPARPGARRARGGSWSGASGWPSCST